MATQDDVRRIAMSLPGVAQDSGRFAFSIDHGGKAKGFAWVWMERVVPKQPRVPNPHVIAVRVANESEKATLLAADPDTFFTEPHYNGFPAVLVRLPQLSVAELRHVIVEAWRCQAPKALIATYDAESPDSPRRAQTAAAPRTPKRAQPRARAASATARKPQPRGSRRS